jgi:general secretion pathway protein L
MTAMTVLRVRCSLNDDTFLCQWALIDPGREPIDGEGPVGELPRHARRVELIIPATEVVITRARLPPRARRRGVAVLAYALEEDVLGEPEQNHVVGLGLADGEDVLAVFDKQGLQRWLDALDDLGIRAVEVYCETLLLPRVPGEWSLAWNGREGFVRTTQIEGGATDCGDGESPPLSLELMLEEAAARNAYPGAIAIHVTTPDALPDLDAWQRSLGLALRDAGEWTWRTSGVDPGTRLVHKGRRLQVSAGAIARLRPAAWIAAAALVLHGLALVADWTRLTLEQRGLRQQIEARFRSVFPDAAAVADPALQMRRKLADARHAAGQPDDGDFLPLLETVASRMNELPSGTFRVISYDSGQLTLELAPVDEAKLGRMTAGLAQAGLRIDAGPASRREGGKRLLSVRSP